MAAAKPENPAAIQAALSAPRVGTYLQATTGTPTDPLELYAWNARIYAAFMLPVHFVEVAIRNAADETIQAVYGSRWPWSAGFERSLSNPPLGYNPRKDLFGTRSKHPSTGKVVADLRFMFWQTMFTASHQQRLWDPDICTAFANTSITSAKHLRNKIHADLERIRQLRNRLAHHEPVFNRDLQADLDAMLELIHLRSPETAQWVRAMEEVTTLLGQRP